MILMFILSALPAACSSGDPYLVNMRASVEVVDENGDDVPDSQITVYFTHTPKQEHLLESRSKKIEKVYDGENPSVFEYQGMSTISIRVEKEGYWTSGLGHDWNNWEEGQSGNVLNEKFTIILRKKNNPRPLYTHKSAYHSTREFGLSRGYDLEVGDLVAPYGKGKISDLVFTIFQKSGEKTGVYENRLELSFSNPDDGVIQVEKGEGSESRLLLGANAPEDGYKKRLEFRRGVADIRGTLMYTYAPSKEELEKIEGYWFRVRSEKDPETGNLEARYGKISGPVTFLVDEEGGAYFFTYFFSPDHSRLLEWNGESLVPGANLQGVKKH